MHTELAIVPNAVPVAANDVASPRTGPTDRAATFSDDEFRPDDSILTDEVEPNFHFSTGRCWITPSDMWRVIRVSVVPFPSDKMETDFLRFVYPP